MTRYAFLIGLGLLATGCTDARIFRAAAPTSPADRLTPDPGYVLGCGDVLAVTFPDQPAWDCLASLGVDGKLPLGPAGTPNLEGLTLEQARQVIARQANLDLGQVDLRLVEIRAGRIYLMGPEAKRMRSVPYQGPESVVSFLDRVGAIKPGCSDLRDVKVIRSNVAAGRLPDVIRVDVEAIVLDHDPTTNVPLQPSDQVVVGETRRSSFSRLLPAWLRPFYRKLMGLLPPDTWPWAR